MFAYNTVYLDASSKNEISPIKALIWKLEML